MQFHEKLQQLRKERGFSQEDLAERLSVSRQAISKWESGSAYPEIEKLVQLSEIFGVTLDSLMKEGPIEYGSGGGQGRDFPFYRPYRNGFWGSRGYEYKSKSTLFGLPLVHINIGFGMRRARGIIAIGVLARGLISIGLLSMGLLSTGLLSLGLLALGPFALGLAAVGAVAIGGIAIGAVAIGAIALGAVAIGMFSTGAVAVASHIAVGDHAYGHIAVGQSVAEGVRTFLSPTGTLRGVDRSVVQAAIGEEFPNLWGWIVRWMTMMLG